ncbi:hypothetical protein R0K05_19810, partial [Planococcus sp. SIMBA_160]
ASPGHIACMALFRRRPEEQSMNTPLLADNGLEIDTPVLLKEGTRLLEPNVYRTHVGGRLAVVKDYGRYRRTLLAPIARLMVRHEARMLQRLQ